MKKNLKHIFLEFQHDRRGNIAFKAGFKTRFAQFSNLYIALTAWHLAMFMQQKPTSAMFIVQLLYTHERHGLIVSA